MCVCVCVSSSLGFKGGLWDLTEIPDHCLSFNFLIHKMFVVGPSRFICGTSFAPAFQFFFSLRLS